MIWSYPDQKLIIFFRSSSGRTQSRVFLCVISSANSRSPKDMIKIKVWRSTLLSPCLLSWIIERVLGCWSKEDLKTRSSLACLVLQSCLPKGQQEQKVLSVQNQQTQPQSRAGEFLQANAWWSWAETELSPAICFLQTPSLCPWIRK